MESSVQDIKSDLENGDGIMEPIVVAYDPDNGYAVVAEGNHRVEAAIQAKEEFVPVVVTTGNVSTEKDGEATPELVEKTPGFRFEAEMTREVNPYFIFPDSDIPSISDSGADLDQNAVPQAEINRVFDDLKARLFSAPTEKVPAAEIPAKRSADVSENKSVVSSILQEVKDAFKSPAQWIRNFSMRDRRPAINPLSNQEYKAFNLVALSAAADKAGFSDPRWLTKAEAEKSYGASLKGDAKPTRIAVPTLHSYEDEDGNKFESVRFEPVEVYNAEQFDGMPTYEAPETVKYTAKEAFEILADRFNQAELERNNRGLPSVLGMRIDSSSVNPDTGKAIRTPNYSKDRIKLPLRSQFKSDEAWIQSLAHELAHSTGLRSRIDREEFRKSGIDSEMRAREEAIAEMASAILMKKFGLDYDTKNSAVYIKNEALREGFSDEDLQDIAVKAQAVVDYMLGNDLDTLPKWDPQTTKRPKTATEFRNTELTPLYSSVNPDTSQDSIDALDLPVQNVDLDQGVKDSKDAKQRVFDSLVEKLKDLADNPRPWRKSFTDGFEFTGGSGMPRNPSSKIIYSGFNSLFLKIATMHAGYKDSRWMTFNQAKEMGGSVRKGEKAQYILRPMKSRITRKDKDGKPVLDEQGNEQAFSKIWFKTIAVFNVEQIDGLNLPDDVPTTNMKPVDAQQFILDRYIKSMEAKGLKAPTVNYSYVGDYGSHDTAPNWAPWSDEITLPGEAQFNSPEEMFDTLMHELTHSTGHKQRLDRTELTKRYAFDNDARAQEELIAEMGAAILSEMFGVNSDVDNTQAYMQSWLGHITKQNNMDALQIASSKAQQAVDYLLGMDLGDWSPLEGYSNYIGKQGKEGDE